MSLKRHCDLCEGEIPDGERYYNVLMRVMRDPDHDADELAQEYADFCYGCTKSGEALHQRRAACAIRVHGEHLYIFSGEEAPVLITVTLIPACYRRLLRRLRTS